MNYEDKTLTCQDCGQPFVFRAADESYHATKRFTNEPKRCPSCRHARRNERNGGCGQVLRETHPWYAPIVVKTPPPRFNPVVTPQSASPIASANGARPHGQAGTGQ